ncbi:hypothetical protein CL654_02000 [bacterium]|nr:hypothetical protein [bacterium]|tara:strand:+ start:31646 stop:32200 length:555 start_codon:yes stop_codon:yes gene_type:complete
MSTLHNIKEVFSHVRYVAIALPIAFVVLAFAVWLPNWRLLHTILVSHDVEFIDATKVAFGLFGSLSTNFTLVSATYTILIAILFGINIAMLVYYVQRRKGSLRGKGATAGVGGLVAGVFGIGCAACGTFLLSVVLALIGAGGLLAFLPLGGEEFGILGVVLLLYSVYWTAQKIDEPLVCVAETN